MSRPDALVSKSVSFQAEAAKRAAERVSEEKLASFLDAFSSINRVFVYGAGRSGMVARAFGIRLHHLGYETHSLGENPAMPDAASDLLVLVSNSGATGSVVAAAKKARDAGARVALLTGREASPAGALATHHIVLDAGTDAGPRARLAPLGTLFESAAGLFLDGIVAELMVRRGVDEVAMQARHATEE